MLAGLHIEALLHGNITAQEAEALAQQVSADTACHVPSRLFLA